MWFRPVSAYYGREVTDEARSLARKKITGEEEGRKQAT
jgi:hypothetical protein